MTIDDTELTQVAVEIHRLVEAHAQGSALRGLSVVTSGLAMVLDVYAQPNDKNPQGMADDPQTLRAYFAGTAGNAANRKQRR